MDILKIHRIAAYICIGLTPIAFVVAGLENSPEQTAKGVEILFMIGGIYLPFYCWRCVHLGFITELGGIEKVYKDEQPHMFWLLTSGVLVFSVVCISLPFK
ncbi:hypothetical protein [Neptuniibacter pectenicola]|uniref:hypothetical protein n=1 Tax=Neptuniibacter pectenicola TaxID=1806669 RepID=UPI000835D57D|nr:hypothetical protein [Neptuniibacter pectenicola]